MREAAQIANAGAEKELEGFSEAFAERDKLKRMEDVAKALRILRRARDDLDDLIAELVEHGRSNQ